MRIAVLSSGQGWHVGDLARAATTLGHEVVPIDFRRVLDTLPPGQGTLDPFAAVIVRTMPPGSLEQVVFRMDVLGRIAARGGVVVNPPRALELCVDKYLASATLAGAGLPVPPTVVCQSADDALAAFTQLGRDVVVKPLFGSEGRGLVRVSDPELAWRTFRTIERTAGVLYLQRFLHHPGWDLRVFVLEGRILAAMRRYARNAGGRGGSPHEEWRTNVAQGGRAEPVCPGAAEADLALRAAAVAGTLAAGVDLIQEAGAWYVLEVNAVPGWRALAPTCGVDVAQALIEATVRRAAERTSLSR
jgi:ribosomal protein S6--L-glutamate ligase